MDETHVPQIVAILRNPRIADEDKLIGILQKYEDQKGQCTKAHLDELVLGVHNISRQLEWNNPTAYLHAARALGMLGGDGIEWVKDMESRIHAAIESHWTIPSWLLPEIHKIIPGREHAVHLDVLRMNEEKKVILSQQSQEEYVDLVSRVSHGRSVYAMQLVLIGLKKILETSRFDSVSELQALSVEFPRMLDRLSQRKEDTQSIQLLCKTLQERIIDLIEMMQ